MYKERTGVSSYFLEFKATVAETIISQCVRRKKIGRPLNSPQIPLKSKARPGVVADIRYDNIGHWPEKMETPNRCRDKNCKRRSRYKCNVHLCPECMASFHTL